MCRRRSIALDADPSVPRVARRFAEGTLAAWELTDPDGVARLLVSELVTNAVLHARTRLEATIGVAGGMLEIAVHDHDPRLPVARGARADLVADLMSLQARGVSDDSEARHPSLHVGEAGSVLAGRGLILVDALADEWGVAELSDGKSVWAGLAVPGDWPYLPECPCTTGAGIRLASGRPVTEVPGPWDGRVPRPVR